MQIPNGDMVNVHSLGQVALGKRLILEHVLEVPDFCFNLLSVSKLIDDLQCTVAFLPNSFMIQDLPSRTPI